MIEVQSPSPPGLLIINARSRSSISTILLTLFLSFVGFMFLRPFLNFDSYSAEESLRFERQVKEKEEKRVTFFEEFENTRSNNFRTRGDVWIMALYAFYLVAKGSNKPFYIAPLRKDLIRYKINYLREGREYTYLTLTNSSLKKIKSKFSAIRKYNPLMFCINDGPNVSDHKRSLTKSFLGEYFPNKSVFEK